MNLENYSGMRSCLSTLDSQILLTPSNTEEYNFSNSITIYKVIIQPRHANLVMCMWFETPVKHWNEALSMSSILNQTLEFDKASDSSELIS